jgi:hypothetical protein
MVIAGCSVPAHIKPVQYDVEKERVINKSFDATWQKAVEWFATHNMPIKNLDKSSGLISTEYTLSIKDAGRYMDSGQGESNFSGKVELDRHMGNFNLLIKKIDDSSTKVVINVFFSCLVNQYRYENFFSTNYVLVSSKKVDCASTGQLEKQVLDFLSNN